MLKKAAPLKLIVFRVFYHVYLIYHSTQNNLIQKFQCLLILNVKLSILLRAFEYSTMQSGNGDNKQKFKIPEQDTQRLDEILEIIIFIDNLPFVKCNLAE